jgi:flagellin-specific chaperone FliS
MQDVIFNGSGNRKPASRASVELVFDNESGRAGGWNQYAEIAVKRVLTRDGNSSYFINNQAVRRRDVQDVFLGTGLGPRAYAIIGQGTISRIIESRPEELRLFLEEAAGVSKYKERRRETENRLKDTRENLTRVEDILRELNANLDKLEQQAEVATRYRGLQEQGTLKLHQLWFLKHRDAATEEERVKLAMLEATNALESRMAELRHVEAELETIRQAHYEASDALHTRQGDLAEASLEVSRLEERIRYVVEGRQRASPPGRAAGPERTVAAAPRRGPGRAGDHRRADRRGRGAGRDPGRPGRGGGRFLARARRRCAPPRPAPTSSAPGGPGAAADPGAGRREPQHRRAEPWPACPARTPGQRAPGPGRAGRRQAAEPARGAPSPKRPRPRPRPGCTS